ncbi:MAG: 6,7-dimethyl-8-ribityllumazine synthase [Lysobacter sp.]
MAHYEGDLRIPDGARFAIIASRWNPRITDTLVAGARKTFADHGVAEDAVDVFRVPGAWEIPLAAARVAAAGRHAGVVALGCVVRGDTRHYEQIADGCAQGLMRVALDYGIPVANGVLAVEMHEDAQARAGGSHGNKGEEAALVAIEMAHLLQQLPKPDALLEHLPAGQRAVGRSA